MKKRQRVLISLLIQMNICLATALYGQPVSEQKNGKINYSVDAKNNTAKGIDFIDERTNKKIKTFDLKTNNPYQSLRFPLKNSKEVNSATYNLSRVNKDQLIKEFIPHIKLSKGEKDYIHFTSTSSDVSTYTGKQYAAIAYQLNVYGEEGDALAMRGTVLVLNQKGDVIFKLPDNHLGCSGPVVTEDGKYLAFQYGAMNVESSVTYTESPGFRIYEVATGKLILNVDSTSSSPLTVEGNKIIELFQLAWPDYAYHVYDPDTRVLYKKAYTFEEYRLLKRKEQNGLVFSTPGGGEKLDSFQKDFIQEPF